MRYLILIALLLSAVTAFTNNLHHLKLKLDLSRQDLSRIEEKWITQPLDHSNPQDKRTLRMRYFENLELWRPNAPIYIYLGGEGQQYPGFIANDGRILTVQIARETYGALFATEHRYYGQSLPNIPTDDLPEYYKFLSSQQALADVANFIKMLKADPKYMRSRVVVIGGSYAGNLAAWARLLFPNLVDAAISSSAPVLAKIDFHEYLDVTRNTIGKYGTPKCLNNIANTFERYGELLKSYNGIETLKRELQLDPNFDLTVLENKETLFESLYSVMKGVAQYGTPLNVTEMCSHYESSWAPHKLESLNFTRPSGEFDSSYPVTDNLFTWTYQYCTEFGYLQSTSSEKQPFVHWNPVNYLVKVCNQFVRGDVMQRLEQGVATTNMMYGGLTPKVTKVVFLHGDMDPWHSLGVINSLGPEAPAFVVDGTSHCKSLIAVEGEPAEMKATRMKVKQLIKKWIS